MQYKKRCCAALIAPHPPLKTGLRGDLGGRGTRPTHSTAGAKYNKPPKAANHFSFNSKLSVVKIEIMVNLKFIFKPKNYGFKSFTPFL